MCVTYSMSPYGFVWLQVQEAVHGVTMEECQKALQNHSWNVQKAVHYLKVAFSSFTVSEIDNAK